VILAAASFIYSLSILAVGSGTFSFAIWAVLAGFFVLAAYLAGGRWHCVPRKLRIAAYAVIVLATIVFGACAAAQLSHFSDEGEPNLDCIIVLGAQVRESGPSVAFRFRLDAACDYLNDNPGTVCVVSGAQGFNEPVSEGEAGRAYLISRGITEERIFAETEARNTTENIAYSLRIFEAKGNKSGTTGAPLRIGVVTNNFHVFRSLHIARKLTEEQSCEICGIAADTIPWYLPNNIVRECFGILRDVR
jgi:uncharacterized SAM-binding protein YcdF (DUF218 family)